MGQLIHELAHASHWNMSGAYYSIASDIVAESWARGVQWQLTRDIYGTYYDNCIEKLYARRKYTGIVEDLIDGNKTRYSYYYYSNDEYISSEKHYNDRVKGYTIRQIEDALQKTANWNFWKLKIISMYENPTENNIHATFDYWAY